MKSLLLGRFGADPNAHRFVYAPTFAAARHAPCVGRSKFMQAETHLDLARVPVHFKKGETLHGVHWVSKVVDCSPGKLQVFTKSVTRAPSLALGTTARVNVSTAAN